MTTFKQNLSEICKEVAAEFNGWSFVSGKFKNGSLKHTDLIVDPGFAFDRVSTPLQPSVHINNKKSMNLYKSIMGYQLSTSLVNFQAVAQELQYLPDHLRLTSWIFEDKACFASSGHPARAVEELVIDIKDVRPVLVAVMADGIAFIDRHYNLADERALLENLPPRYETRHINLPYDEMERQKGVMICVVRILLGDFDFVERYRSDDFDTIYPKRIMELDKIISALPDLKVRFMNHGPFV
ncbi:hypothetical protein [Dyella ginsengisoli]|uniref:hypothetical protein n=1 Tax=Dyella ginsengisoli TaxID=363848 RepID=UPI000349236B|nr:hypothetical protein [Dyella ginsengisoli]